MTMSLLYNIVIVVDITAAELSLVHHFLVLHFQSTRDFHLFGSLKESLAEFKYSGLSRVHITVQLRCPVLHFLVPVFWSCIFRFRHLPPLTFVHAFSLLHFMLFPLFLVHHFLVLHFQSTRDFHLFGSLKESLAEFKYSGLSRRPHH